MANRLEHATSPYLLQHKDNPVDWRQWGEAAFAEASRRDAPILLSVGYAACHWCHVMAHESFEDPEVADLMNKLFVNVKVDREERPDVDSTYMAATQALTGQGGWPMTVFLTPQGRPFYAGTYYPPVPRGPMPSFRQLLTAVSNTWNQRRGEVLEAGARIAKALADQAIPSSAGASPPDWDTLTSALQKLVSSEDPVHGGFGGAPKFPPSMVLEFLIRYAAAQPRSPGGRAAHDLAGRTLRAMARSGMYDQVAGGFARYSVDAGWVVPHFEKMLYDNAQLARVYLHWWRLTGEAVGSRIAQETCDWMVSALLTDEHGLASSLDADTEVVDEETGERHGEEGRTYVWTPEDLLTHLGPEDGVWAAALLRVGRPGTFEHGASTAQLAQDVWADPFTAARWEGLREKLRAVRTARPQPGRDDKVVAAWNGLAIAALAETGALLNRPDLVEAAGRIANLVLRVHLYSTGGLPRLHRASRHGNPGAAVGVLEDYADLAEGLLTLHHVTGDVRWLATAGNLLEVVMTQFIDDDGVHDTASDSTDEALRALRRPADPTDNAYPSGASAAAGALLSYAALTGSPRAREAAQRCLAATGAVGGHAPQAFGWGLAVSVARLDGPREIAIVGYEDDPVRLDLHLAALASTAPGAVISAGVPDAPGVPLLAGRPLARSGEAQAFVCHDFACHLPATTVADLEKQLAPEVPATEDF
ncbi:thioredoxin domain-containing protein [Kineosporia sp. NBRC 101731]|uniref:thioredoxin domain-containing protein n=1 Tax=Kineosporia sp. NBRC 101731 TaxID=3032199 RepID=UPI0024A0CA78|nr:thioredoxin domain-containing protein [Kineosporia sp. NBRC 101731]GLY28614.1 thioredoxin domain-containing protein [Kineosporia sp. NBRC 101731]